MYIFLNDLELFSSKNVPVIGNRESNEHYVFARVLKYIT